MRVKLLTLSYAPSLQGFDDRPLAEFVRDKEVLAVREHFFTVHDLPHLACLITDQPAPATAGEPAEPGRKSRPDPLADLALFEILREWRAARARARSRSSRRPCGRSTRPAGWSTVEKGALVRRAGNLWADVVAFPSLLQTAHRAALGKRTARSVARFSERAEPEVLRLQRELEAGAWRTGRAATFEISDPKRRTITAVPFRDQVVHHALMAVLEPVFERRMVFDSYACRRGKGTHAALQRARQFVRRFAYFLKLDVKSFFASVPHAAVRETLAHVVKDRRVPALCAAILAGPRGEVASFVADPLGLRLKPPGAGMLRPRLRRPHQSPALRSSSATSAGRSRATTSQRMSLSIAS